MSGEFPNTVERAGVETSSAVRLSLQTDSDVFDGRAEDCVGETGECSGEVVLGVAERGGGVGFQVSFFKGSSGVVEATELDGDTGADSD